jgi:hypothetical protein
MCDGRYIIVGERGKAAETPRDQGEKKEYRNRRGEENIEGLYGVEMEIWGRCEGPLMGMWQ